MAEVTSGRNLTVIVLEQHEADALAGMLHRWADDDTIEGDPRLWELYNALVPTDEDDEPVPFHLSARAVASVLASEGYIPPPERWAAIVAKMHAGVEEVGA